jgi:hypothetical protein
MLNLGPIAKALRRFIGRPSSETDVAVLAFGLANARGKIGATIDPVTGSLVAQSPCATLPVSPSNNAIPLAAANYFITKSSAAALTLASPVAGAQAAGGDDGKVLRFISTTAQNHTVACSAGFGGVGASRDLATFGGAVNDGFAIVAFNGVWHIAYTRNVTLG